MSDESTQSTPIPEVGYEVDGVQIVVPKRFGSQEVLAAYADRMNDDEFAVLCSVLRDRRWSDHEFETRIRPLRPDHPLFNEEAEVADEA